MQKVIQNEHDIVQNVVNKIELFIKSNNMNLHTFANSLGFQYQPFYRLIKQKRVPNITSLVAISNHLGYAFEDLISDKIYTQLFIIEDLQKITSKPTSNYQIFLPFVLHVKYLNEKLFCIIDKKISKEYQIKEIYYTIDKITEDGKYLILINGSIEFIQIINLNSKNITIQNEDSIKILSYDEFQPIARLVGMVAINNTKCLFVDKYSE